MAEYTLFLQEGIKSEVLFETDDFSDAEEFLYQKWHEIEGNQVLLLLGENGFNCTRPALNGNPLSEWEEKRLESLRHMQKDITRNGDITLKVRGLVVEFEEDHRKYVRIA